uniref:Uncharacterized protein n=1 Tax=Oryza barthii TaxID=65489 RepID=A0A0D3H6B6_9ORYZ
MATNDTEHTSAGHSTMMLGWCNPTESCSWSLCTTWSLEIGVDLFETGEGGGDEHARQEIIFLGRVVGVRSVGAEIRPTHMSVTYWP